MMHSLPFYCQVGGSFGKYGTIDVMGGYSGQDLMLEIDDA